jgi:hypothetical protein
LTCVLFFVSGEYRHPAALALCACAAAALDLLLGGLVPRAVPHARTIGPAMIGAVLAIPIVFWPFEPIRTATDPSLDAFNYATAALARADGAVADHDRASAIIETARVDAPGSLLLADASVWLLHRKAVDSQDPDAAWQALRSADALAAGLRSVPEGPYRRSVKASLIDRVADLAGREFVRRDALLAAEADASLRRLSAAE